MKYCKDCCYCKNIDGDFICEKNEFSFFSPVDGKKSRAGNHLDLWCVDERSPGFFKAFLTRRCGKSGRYFKSRAIFMPQIKVIKNEEKRIDKVKDKIWLNQHEIQSKFDRVKNAEGLILQLPKNHDGRNNWLLNYGQGAVAIVLRETDSEQRKEKGLSLRKLVWNERTESLDTLM